MRLRRRVGVFAVAVLGSATTGTAQVAGPPPAPQNPSPMVERSRAGTGDVKRCSGEARRQTC